MSEEKRTNQHYFKEGDTVFFTAFTKQNKELFYMCQGIIESVPSEEERQVFKVKIVAVGDRPIGGAYSENMIQGSLLNRVITKKFKELHKNTNQFMRPQGWLKVVADK